MAEKLTASMEDYIEAIFQIFAEKQVVRAKDIADRLNVTRPSVTGALQTLAQQGMVEHAPYEVITLTDAGEKAARTIIYRHETLKHFFVDVLGAEQGEADVSACAMEHVISDRMLKRLADFMRQLKNNGKGKGKGKP